MDHPSQQQPKGRSQFIGLAGEHYVVYSLLVRRMHASVIGGNVPNVDVLVSSGDGSSQLSLQVKTSRSAHRRNRFGHEAYEWDMGRSSIRPPNPRHWYAFLDMKESNGKAWNPVVYLVPSLWVHDWVSRWPNASRPMYVLKAAGSHLCEEKWEYVDGLFRGDRQVIKLTESIPEAVAWPRQPAEPTPKMVE